MQAVTLKKIQHSLKTKLDKPALTNTEVTEGIRECFINCQTLFMQKRRPDMSEQQASRFAIELIQEVYDEQGLKSETATPTMLRHVIHILNNRFEFMQDPELSAVHLNVMELLLSKLSSADSQTATIGS